MRQGASFAVSVACLAEAALNDGTIVRTQHERWMVLHSAALFCLPPRALCDALRMRVVEESGGVPMHWMFMLLKDPKGAATPDVFE